MTATYGLHTIETRKALWSGLRTVAHSIGQMPWLLAGDLNSILSDMDRINGSSVTSAEIQDFNDFLSSRNLVLIKSIAHYYSWHKGSGVGKVSSRIDWGLGNIDWIQKYGEVVVDYLNPCLSDHSPLLINCIPEYSGRGRPFRFFNFLADHSKFQQTVQTSWQGCNSQGSCMDQL